MPLLAGYFAQSKCEPHVLSAAVEGFQVTSAYKVDGKQSVSRIIETKYGHQLVHSSPNAIIQPTVVQDNNGNSLTLLGIVRPTSASLLLDSAVHKGATSLEHLEGQFVVVFCDTESGAVHVVNDRFGSRPFYFLRAGDKTYYASSLRFLFRLAGIRPSPDPLGWLQIFTYWHTFGQRTNRLGAVRLRPASHVTISLEGLDDRQYWQLTHEPSDIDLQAHADATFEAFEESAAWRARRFRRCLIAL